MKPELVLVIDWGGPQNQLLPRIIRSLAVYCEIVPYDITYQAVMDKKPRAIILAGDPENFPVQGAALCDPRLFNSGIPVLGIGTGMQVMADFLGGRVVADHAEQTTGAVWEPLRGLTADVLWTNVEEPLQVLVNTGAAVQLPPGFQQLAAAADGTLLAMKQEEAKLYGVQFPLTDTGFKAGQQILENFLLLIAGCSRDWDLDEYISGMVADIRERVGEHKVLCALSGGVDSSVAAALVHKAVGDKLTCVYVNHGLMRQGESEQVIAAFKENLGINLVFTDRSQQFLSQLAGVEDPETKRKIIGREFIRVFEEEAGKLGKIDFLVQGTIYPDIVESGTAAAGTIKSHHNVGGLPEDMQFALIEPLRHLFKDEVRVIGEKIGLPRSLVWRQPFPGPGLGVRVLGAITPEKVEMLRAADAIVREEIENAGLTESIWQSFAILPPVKSVGMHEGTRTYGYPIIIRAVNSDDAMTAEWVQLPYAILDNMAKRIVQEVPGINRVAYDITSKPPATIEWE